MAKFEVGDKIRITVEGVVTGNASDLFIKTEDGEVLFPRFPAYTRKDELIERPIRVQVGKSFKYRNHTILVIYADLKGALVEYVEYSDNSRRWICSTSYKYLETL